MFKTTMKGFIARLNRDVNASFGCLFSLRCEDQCRLGFYGVNCGSKCLCKNDAACSHVDGSCQCPLGFGGALCESRGLDVMYLWCRVSTFLLCFIKLM